MACSYPLITLSTRAQVESRRAATPFLEAVQRIVAREGLAGLFAGLDSALFGISVTNFVYYYWYEWARAAFAARRRRSSSARLTTVESMLAGALAGSATVLITNPIWVVNTRMTTRRQGAPSKGEAGADDAAPSPSGRSPTTVGTLLALLRHEGPLALFAGVVPALVLVANPILQYTLFEQLRNAVERRRPVTPAIAFVLGALGKLFATTVTYPYITVKSQMHVATRPADREGMRQAISRVVRDEGYAGLYKGASPSPRPLLFPSRPSRRR